MRVGAPRRRDERGVVAVFVAIVALLLFSAAAYAIDAGNLWQTRRNMVTASDASALGAAGEYAVGNDACASGGAASTLLDGNRRDAVLDACVPVGVDDDRGHVTVSGHTTATFTFAGLLGIRNRSVRSTTTAEWGIPSGAAGLRPFGLCLYANDQLRAWLDLPAGPTGQSAPITITYGKSQPDACGTNVPGNWGVQDFDGGANSNADIKDWTLNGYPGVVGVGATVPGDTGAFSNSLDGPLGTLEASGDFFPLPVFDGAAGTGSNARFHIVAFVFVKLVDFKTTGAEANRSLTLVFDRGVISGQCCGQGLDTGTRVVRICDVDTLSPDTTDPRAC